MTNELIHISGHENRFKRVGRYDMDTLLRDLRDLQRDVDTIVDGVNSGALQGPRGLPGQPGLPGKDAAGIQQIVTLQQAQEDQRSLLWAYAFTYGFTFATDEVTYLRELYALIFAQSKMRIVRDCGLIEYDRGSVVDSPTSYDDMGALV